MYKGTGVSDGIGIGKAVVIGSNNMEVNKTKAQPEEEKLRYYQASNQLVLKLHRKVKETGDEQGEILESHIMLLQDPFIISEVENVINKEQCNCEYAVETVLDTYIKMFKTSGDELLETRASDLKDIKNNLLATLAGIDLVDISKLEPNSVLVAEEITTSVAAGINAENISAIITKLGGKTSHTAIIARSIGIPAIVGASIEHISDGDLIVADGTAGLFLKNPAEEDLKRYQTTQAEYLQKRSELEKLKGVPSITQDGVRVELCANVGLEMDISNAVKADAEGIGLFRTEFLYMNGNAPPSEKEQFTVYKTAAEEFGQRPVIIRTLDIGGDKDIPYLGLAIEENPFLGWRAIRYCLDRPEIFREQLRAILKASAYGNIKIMIPMVSSLDEMHKSRAIIENVKQELQKKSIPFNQNIPIGMMVETPAAAIMADKFVEAADFFSIGTNDLTQYVMAVDRGNQRVASLYSSYDPAVLRMIYNVAQAAEKKGILCAVCGEAGGDPLMIKFLVGCGIRELSMSSGMILEARGIVRGMSVQEIRKKIDSGLSGLKDVNDGMNFLKQL